MKSRSGSFLCVAIICCILVWGAVGFVKFKIWTISHSSLSPPPTQEELAQFRIVKSQDGVFAVEQLVDGRWELRPNRWQNTNQCYKDMEWWIEQYRIRNVEKSRAFTPIVK